MPGKFFMLEAVYRFSKQSTLKLPVQIRSSGYYQVWENWHDLVRVKHFLELFWCISGEVRFQQDDGTAFTLKEEECCCYFPGDCHRIHAPKPSEFCWITFDGNQCSSLIDSFSLPRTPWHAGKCPLDVFTRLRIELRNPGTESELQAGVLGYELLSRAKTPIVPGRFGLVERFLEEVEKNFDDPDLSVDSIADTLGVHRSTLMRNVYAVCGDTPQQYLTNFRMQQALTLLQEPGISIKELAQKTGFASANYFGKVFLHTFGKTPSAMRKKR